MAEERNSKNELPLPPGTYAFIQDTTKGNIKLFVGPVMLTKSGQDWPVVYNYETFLFDQVGSLAESVRKCVVAPEGFYAILTNPAKAKDGGKTVFPPEGPTPITPDLTLGLKENIPGPVNFALFPGQTCEVRRGHQLRSNQYLRIKIYNEEEAKKNWTNAVAKSVDDTSKKKTILDEVPADLAVGKQYNILGTEVAFYIPPTGVSVVPVPNELDPTGKELFVRQAETLERLEYCILVDEDGTKEYPRGPKVQFPKPTQEFIEATDEHNKPLLDDEGRPIRKYKATEMNALQGIHLKLVDTDVLPQDEQDITPEMGAPKEVKDGIKYFEFHAGDEVFLRGSVMPIYFPSEKHTLLRYDRKSLHYATAVTEGTGKYVLDRITGNVELIKGPAMLLPNPIRRTIAYRPLSERQSKTWFPGIDGKGSPESLAWNEKLRKEAGIAPTTRTGVVSEGQLLGDKGGEVSLTSGSAGAAMNFMADASLERGAYKSSRIQARSSQMQESRQGKEQQAVFGDNIDRRSTYNEPRTIILGAEFRNVPTIRIQPGYAISVVKPDGRRVPVIGPKTVLMEFSDTLDILRLSMGKPKTTDFITETVYLNIHNNKVSDVVEVETVDHVVIQLKLAYLVNFVGDSAKWFTIENYVKHLCDHIRSILKGEIRKMPVEEFYRTATAVIRDLILGPKAADGKVKRPGLLFEENNSQVVDVEVLGVVIADRSISELISRSQHMVVSQNINLSMREKELETVKRTQILEREQADAVHATEVKRHEIDKHRLVLLHDMEITKLDTEKKQTEEKKLLQDLINIIEDIRFRAELERNRTAGETMEELAGIKQERELMALEKHTEALVKQLQAVTPGFVEALQGISNKDTLVQMSKALSFQQLMGAESAADLLLKLFSNTHLSGLVGGIMEKAALAANGTVKNQNIPPSQA